MEVNGPMQIEIATEILETIFTYATTAAHLTGYLDDPITVDGIIVIEEVAKSLEARVPHLLSKPATGRILCGGDGLLSQPGWRSDAIPLRPAHPSRVCASHITARPGTTARPA